MLCSDQSRSQDFLISRRSRFSATLDEIGVGQAPWRAVSSVVSSRFCESFSDHCRNVENFNL